eukprot:3909045-Pyramimonas_sp.AAC.1
MANRNNKYSSSVPTVTLNTVFRKDARSWATRETQDGGAGRLLSGSGATGISPKAWKKAAPGMLASCTAALRASTSTSRSCRWSPNAPSSLAACSVDNFAETR